MLAVFAVIALIGAVILLGQPQVNSPPKKEATEKPADTLTDSIELPGYSMLELRAGVREQGIGFQNPARNFCYIQPSLWLADGTLLWRGQLIAPGDIGNEVVLAQPLAAGDYKDAVLRYDCFRMDEEKTPLNGASNKLTLKVQ